MMFVRSMIVVIMTLSSLNAYAGTLVDTGINAYFLTSIANRGPDHWARIAVNFSLEDRHLVTDILAGVHTFGEAADISYALYRDQQGEPGYLLHQETVSVASEHESILSTHWAGLRNLNLILEAGSYWLELTSAAGVEHAGWSYSLGALPRQALIKSEQFANWTPFDGARPRGSLALKIQGEISAVPEPNTYVLLIAGFSIILLRRKIFHA